VQAFQISYDENLRQRYCFTLIDQCSLGPADRLLENEGLETNEVLLNRIKQCQASHTQLAQANFQIQCFMAINSALQFLFIRNLVKNQVSSRSFIIVAVRPEDRAELPPDLHQHLRERGGVRRRHRARK